MVKESVVSCRNRCGFPGVPPSGVTPYKLFKTFGLKVWRLYAALIAQSVSLRVLDRSEPVNQPSPASRVSSPFRSEPATSFSPWGRDCSHGTLTLSLAVTIFCFELSDEMCMVNTPDRMDLLKRPWNQWRGTRTEFRQNWSGHIRDLRVRLNRTKETKAS